MEPTRDYDSGYMAGKTDLLAEILESCEKTINKVEEKEIVKSEKVCQKCGRDNPVWFIENQIWNKYSGKYHFLCPVCFINNAELLGIETTGWKLSIEEKKNG